MDPRILELARIYAFQIELGKTPDEAREHTGHARIGATPDEVIEAIRAYRQGLTIAQNIAGLPGNAPLYYALGGLPVTQTEVGVRVKVTLGLPDGSVIYRTIYVNLNWNAPIASIDDKVDEYLRSRSERYPAQAITHWELSGPTFWAPA